jgi:LasA protease
MDRLQAVEGTGGNHSAGYYQYFTQSGDTLRTIAIRFNAFYSEIKAADGSRLPEQGLLPPGLELIIPKKLAQTTESTRSFPDSEIVFSKSSARFDVKTFIYRKKGYLAAYADEEGRTGSEIVLTLARVNSVNPKILISILEKASGWLTNRDPDMWRLDYPMNFRDPYHKGLYRQLMLAIDYLERGYYGWREARIVSLYFNDGESIRLAPDLNAGTVAVMYYFSKITWTMAEWERAVRDYYDLYVGLFGDPRANAVEPLYPASLDQPALILPFPAAQSWCFSNGPHGAWDSKGPAAAVDFAPPQYEYSTPSSRIVVASAAGTVVRSGANSVVIDLDSDGLEQTGWNLFYFHIADEGRVTEQSAVQTGEQIGYASNEGGASSGIHVHFARKYNGEWILAGGPVPFALSGWKLTAGGAEGEWDFIRSGRVVIASKDCNFPNMISR